MNAIKKRVALFLLLFVIFLPLCAEKVDSAKFKVLQFNIWNESRGIDGGYEAVVDEIIKSGADFITLSEVRNYNKDFTKKLCEDIEQKTGKRYYSFRSDDSGLLSSHPIAKYETVYTLNGDRGSIYKAITQIAGIRVALYTAHLDYTHYACYYPRGYDGDNWKKLDNPVTNVATIKKMNLLSYRDEQIKAFINDAEKEKRKGSLIVLGGDFNEPSYLDWGENMKNIFDHNGVIYEWDQSKVLSQNGFIDAYREVYPNPVVYPGITYPADNSNQAISSLTWAKEADERERIDFIYYGAHADLNATQACIVGPEGTISRSQRVKNPGKDSIVTPQGIWPSDHRAVLIEFTLKDADIRAADIDPLTPEEKEEIEAAEKNKVVEASSAKNIICYRIKNVATGLYAARGEWPSNIRLLTEDDANLDAQAFWWFEDGTQVDQKYIIHNYASLDNLSLYSLDNNFKDSDPTEWNIVKDSSSIYCRLGWGNNDDYDWTATVKGIVNKKSIGDNSQCLWLLEKAESASIPLPYIKPSNSSEKYYYSLLNRQKDQFVATAPSTSDKGVFLDEFQDNELHQFWYFEPTGNSPQDFYVRNAAFPELYLTMKDDKSLGTEPVIWNLQLSETANTAVENEEKTEIKKYFVLRRKGESQCLSYTSHHQGAELTLWDGSNTNWCDTWSFDEKHLGTKIDNICIRKDNSSIFNILGQPEKNIHDHKLYIKNGKKFYIK